MSTNPFTNNKVETLKEVFPNVTYEHIEEVLLSVNGDVEKAIDLLLKNNNNNNSNKQQQARQQQQQPHIKPSLSIKKNTQNLKACKQTVREELAQWRQELLHQHEQRRTNIKHLTRDFNKRYDCHSRSNSTQNRNGYYYNEAYIRDVINESSSAAIKAVNSAYNIVSNSVNNYMQAFEPPTFSSSSSSSNNNNNNNMISNTSSSSLSSSSSYNSTYNQTNMNSNPQRPNELRSSQSHTSLSTQQQRPSELKPSQSHTTIQSQQHPSAPSLSLNNNINNTMDSDTTIVNPFNHFEHTSDADLLAPPPTYEQSEHDRLVTPTAPILH